MMAVYVFIHVYLSILNCGSGVCLNSVPLPNFVLFLLTPEVVMLLGIFETLRSRL